MKTIFTIPSNSLLILKQYSKLIAKMSDVTNKQFFVVTDKKMSVYITGKQSILTFNVDIDGYSSDKTEDYIALSYDKFITTAERITNNDALSVTIDDGGLKLLLKSTTSKSKVTLSCFDTTSDEEIEATKKEYKELIATHFAANAKSINLTKGLMDFAKVSSKFMKLTAKSNSIQVGKHTVKYADNTSIVIYTDDEVLLESDDDSDTVTVHNMVLDLVDAASKTDRVVKYSDNGQFVLFESSSLDELTFIVNVPTVQFDFPTDDEATAISPDDNSKITIKFNRENFMSSLNVFDGLFDSSIWKWKPLKFTFNKDTVTSNQINLSHSDSNAEAERDCDIVSYTNTSDADEASFIFSSEFYKNVLEFGQSIFKSNQATSGLADDLITVEFSNAAIDEEHGLGVVVSSEDGSLKAIFAKFQE